MFRVISDVNAFYTGTIASSGLNAHLRCQINHEKWLVLCTLIPRTLPWYISAQLW